MGVSEGSRCYRKSLAFKEGPWRHRRPRMLQKVPDIEEGHGHHRRAWTSQEVPNVTEGHGCFVRHMEALFHRLTVWWLACCWKLIRQVDLRSPDLQYTVYSITYPISCIYSWLDPACHIVLLYRNCKHHNRWALLCSTREREQCRNLNQYTAIVQYSAGQ